MDKLAVDAVLQFYPTQFRPRRVDKPPEASGFSGAVILRIEAEAGTLCLRGWPPETTEVDRIRGLHRLLSHLRTRGIEVIPVPISSNGGATLVSTAGRWWQLEPWMPGQADFYSTPTASRLVAAAEALARVHRAVEGFKPVGPEANWFFFRAAAVAPAVAERIERINAWTPEALTRLQTALEENREKKVPDTFFSIVSGFRRCGPQVAHEHRAAQRLRVDVQPCLRDVWHDHILFTGDQVTGLIDPSAARTDTVAADLSRLLGSLVGDDRRLWDIALAAYQEVRPLTWEERLLVDVLDRSGLLLSGMNWLARRFLAGIEFEDSNRVVARLKRIADRLQVLSRTLE
jgi:Ser/Thr protein kinase RdoA (MazF antagonist)